MGNSAASIVLAFLLPVVYSGFAADFRPACAGAPRAGHLQSYAHPYFVGAITLDVVLLAGILAAAVPVVRSFQGPGPLHLALVGGYLFGALVVAAWMYGTVLDLRALCF